MVHAHCLRNLVPLFLVVLLVPVCGGVGCAAQEARPLDIYWVDVEGGAATLIVTPAGESILVDTGMPGDRDPARIARLAKNVAGLERIDHLVISHFDIDHFGGTADLAKLIPISKVYDHGGSPGERHQAAPGYMQARAGKHVAMKPGDRLPLEEAAGSPKLSVVCLTAAQKFIAPGADHKRNAERCEKAERREPDRSENANSIVLLLKFGHFDFLDATDLTWNLEEQLVCPVNLAGEVDVYQVNHHGLDMSNNPVLIHSVAPTVAVMNNGDRKGCGPRTFTTLKSVPSIQAIYQLHKNLRRDREHNTESRYIANTTPADQCKANHIKLSVDPTGKKYTVSIPATGHAQVYQSK